MTNSQIEYLGLINNSYADITDIYLQKEFVNSIKYIDKYRVSLLGSYIYAISDYLNGSTAEISEDIIKSIMERINLMINKRYWTEL